MIIRFQPNDDVDPFKRKEPPEEWTDHVNYFDFIPNEVLLKIMSYLDTDSHTVMERVNRRTRKVAHFRVDDVQNLPYFKSKKLKSSDRKSIILKYPNLSCICLTDGDCFDNHFASELADKCPAISSFTLVSVHGLSFILQYCRCLKKGNKDPLVEKIVLKMRPDTQGILEKTKQIMHCCPNLKVLEFSTTDGSVVRKESLEKLTTSLCDTQLKVLESTSKKEEVNQIEQVLDDNDIFWNFYLDNVIAAFPVA